MAFDAKKALLSVGEDSVKALIKQVVRPLAEDYIANSPNKIDDILLPFVAMLEAALVESVDKIDGEVG